MTSICSSYEVTRFSAKRLNNFFGKESSADSALCSAFVNTDKNHFYFCFPDLVSNKSSNKFVCLWCNNLSHKQFCDQICEIYYDLYQLYFYDSIPVSKLRFTFFNE